MQKSWYKICLHKFFLFTFAPPPAVLVFCPGKPSSSSLPSLLFKRQASLPRLSLTPKLINHKLIVTLKCRSWKWLPWPFKWDFIEALRRLCLWEDQRMRDCCCEHPRAIRPTPLSTASSKMPWGSLCCNNRENMTQRSLQGETTFSSRTRAIALAFRNSWVNKSSLDFDFWAVHFGLGFPEYLFPGHI